MKKILILVLLINCCLSAFCESMREVGGNKVVVNKSTISIDGLNTKRSFYVKVDEEGSYYLNLFILGGKSLSGILKEYPIMINGICVDTIVSKKPSWHSFNSSKPYMFKRGDNIVEIFDSAPHVANVDNIFLTQHQIINSEDSVKYTEYVNSIKTKNSPLRNIPSELYDKSFNLFGGDETNFPFVASCMAGYKAKYTFSQMVRCEAGDTLTVYTNPTIGGPYVVDVYNYYNPTLLSQTLYDCYCDFIGKIPINIDGWYEVRLRGLDGEYDDDGTCDIAINGEMYVDVPFSNVDIEMPISCYSGNLIFACNNIDIVPSLSYQDFGNRLVDNGYYQISGTKNIDIENINLVKSISVYSNSPIRPYYPVDIYLNVNQLSDEIIFKHFPKLKNTFVPVVDSITDTYNCFAWSVGIWDHWEDPTDDFYTDCILGGQRYPEELYYDDFYMSNGYLRCDLKDAVIFLWGNKDGKDSTFLHASTSRYSNNDNIPHGYDLESKIGSLERIYHTYDHINGYGYGKLLAYYKPGTLFKNKSLYEKVADGEVMMRNYVVEDDKRSFIKEKVSSIENNKLNVFNRLFVNWKNDIKNSIYSTFKQLRTLESYKPLRDFVSNDSILRYAIMELIANNEQFAIPLLEDEILPYNRDAYNEVSIKLKDVKNRNVKTKFYSSPISNAKLFINCILENKILRSHNFGNENIVTPLNKKSDINMRVSCNDNTCVINVDVESKYPTTCCIYTLNGQLVANLAQEAKLSTGTHVFTHLYNKKGTYLVYFENGNIINIKKIIIK